MLQAPDFTTSWCFLILAHEKKKIRILLYKHYFANEFQIYTNWTVVLEGEEKKESHSCICDSAFNLSRLPELV